MKGVYFIYDCLSNEVKIGKSNNAYRRMQQARTFNPRVLLLIVIPSEQPYRLEKYLHKIFADEHNTGEWFHFSQRIKNYIKHYETTQDRQRQKALASRIEVPRAMDGSGAESYLIF